MVPRSCALRTMRAAIRLSALSEAGVIYIMTHDSIALGEDGPTQPVEHLAALRVIPDLLVIRPADGNETSGAYKVAIQNRTASILASTAKPAEPAWHLD